MKPVVRSDVDHIASVATAFPDAVLARVARTGSMVCLGIDPRPSASALTHPSQHGGDASRISAAVIEYFGAILDTCHDRLACCKPQIAFFEALGVNGMATLAGIITHARSLGLPVLLDAKRGDIGSTAEAYAAAYLGDGPLAADAITLNAYMGLDTLEPFLDRSVASGRGVFVVVRTSNPHSADIQALRLADGRLVAEALADRLTERAAALPAGTAGYTALGAVLAGTEPEAAARLRRRLPRSLILVPGYGAQGGRADDAVAAFDANGTGAVVNASRSLTYLGGDSLAEVAGLASAAVDEMRRELEQALRRRGSGSPLRESA